MKINSNEVLHKTHYGLTIYAYVLRQYYEGETVLSLKGTCCEPTKNPFNDNKRTLRIMIRNSCAMHTDSDNTIEPGNAFDFASIHYGLSGQELLKLLNKAMNLGIGNDRNQYDFYKGVDEKLTNHLPKPTAPVFSYFRKPISNITPLHQVSLVEVYKMIKGYRFARCTSSLRKIKDERAARKYKAVHFDYVTFSGTFSQRNDLKLQKHSGLLTLDFDHLEDPLHLRSKLLQDPYFETELLFISPSGNGLKWIIPIDLTKENHEGYFKAVANYINHTYKVKVDLSGKNVSRACFLPHDPQIIINKNYIYHEKNEF